MNVIVIDIHSKSKYSHFFALIVKLRYKYYNAKISYELNNVKVLL